MVGLSGSSASIALQSRLQRDQNIGGDVRLDGDEASALDDCTVDELMPIRLAIFPADEIGKRLDVVGHVRLQLLHYQATDSTYFARLRELVNGIEDQDWAAMGFPDDWRNRPPWNF